jgi:hypothetical protein
MEKAAFTARQKIKHRLRTYIRPPNVGKLFSLRAMVKYALFSLIGSATSMGLRFYQTDKELVIPLFATIRN